ncbi:MAG: cytochrome c [Sphingomonas sp.]|uniref:c-type cytochrome n=1 Tax=Sphingomonas sp. TaxID=28214 RepID=UPI003360CDCF
MTRINWRHHLPSVTFIGASVVMLVIATAAFLYSGFYNIAADDPHTRPVYALLESLRDRSIAVRARGIQPPADLTSPQRVAVGAGLYNEMCSGCHLGPGVEASEMSEGLYPQAPLLSEIQDLTAGQQFWVIKHGVKLSAMPAWGELPPSEWSIDYDSLDRGRDDECLRRSTSPRRSSGSCVRLRSCWARAARPRRRAGGSRSASRLTIAGARNMVV